MRRSLLWLLPWWLLCAGWVVDMRLRSPGILEGGDGVQHYQIARYAWQHPELLLHHWGKPLFTLLASPFAQLGHWGMVLFNAVCFVLTAWAADGLLRRAGLLARLLFPPVLLLTPVYGTMVLAGMTEVFFGLLTIVVLRLLWEDRNVAAIVVASFMPFARPEYIAFVPFVLAWVAYKRQWKALPFLLTGHVVYGMAGGFVFGKTLWAFHQDPYTGAADIYGRGDLFHFIDRVQDMFGAVLAWLVCAALLSGAWLWRTRAEHRPTLRLLLIVGLLPCLAILGTHTLLWWQGLKGSLGLLRVMATAAPLLALCALWPIGVLSKGVLRTWPGQVSGLLVLGTILVGAQYKALVAHQPLPTPQQAYEPFLKRAGERVKALVGSFDRLVCYHPQVAFHAEADPFDQEKVFMGWRPEKGLPSLGLRKGDLLVWDAHFGPNEGKTELEPLLADPELDLIAFFVPEERLIMLGGRPLEAFLFRPGSNKCTKVSYTMLDAPLGVRSGIEHHLDTIRCGDHPNEWCFGASEFPLAMNDLLLDTAGQVYTEVVVGGALHTASGADLKWVLEGHLPHGRPTGYWSQDLAPGNFAITYRIEPPPEGAWFKLYIWNPGRTRFSITDLHLEVTQVVRPDA
jgi:hypothetical protein